MAAAEGCSALSALEPLGAPWREMLAGALEALDLAGKKDAGLAEACATRYLARSASCLTRLDLRSLPLPPPSPSPPSPLPLPFPSASLWPTPQSESRIPW